MDDATQILSCLRAAFEPYRHEYTPAGFDDTVLSWETIDVRLRLMSVFVAEEKDGRVIGTVGCGAVSAEEGHIRGMAVLPEWHGRGVASELLRAAEEELREKGCRRVTLDTTAPLKRAIKFYERNGYQASGKVGDFFGMELFEYVKPL
jgi:GNAT superfamily N-acetyltransferase